MVQAVVFVFLIACLIMGLMKAGKIADLRSFALGDKDIGTGLLFMTVLASHLGAGSTLSVIECINNIGLVFFLYILLQPVQWWISSIFYLNIHKFEGCITSNEIMGRLYGKPGFIVSLITDMIDSVAVASIQMMVFGSILNTFCGVSLVQGTLMGATVMMLYASTGGVKGVIITDVVQGVVFLIAIPIVLLTCMNVADFSQVFASLPEEKTWFVPGDYNQWIILVGLLIQAVAPQGAIAMFIQRMLISGDAKQLSKIFTALCWADFALALCIGVIALYVMNFTSLETISRTDIFNLISTLPEWLISTIVLGLVALVLSTCDSHLNIAAVMFTQDVYKKFVPKKNDKHYVNVARLSTVMIGLIAILIALNATFIFSVLIFAYTVVCSLRVIPQACGFLDIKFSQKQFIIACMVASVGIMIGYFIEGKLDFYSLALGVSFDAITLLAFKWRPKFKPRLGSEIALPAAVYMLLTTKVFMTGLFQYHDIALVMVLAFLIARETLELHKYNISNIFTYVGLSLYMIFSVCWILGVIRFAPIAHISAASLIALNIGIFLFTLLYWAQDIITTSMTKAEEYKYLSNTDILTQLPNRRYVNSLAFDENDAVIYLDIEKLNEVTEQYGSEAGNDMLKHIANAMNNICRRGRDLAVRYAEDEFLIIVRSGDAEDMASMLDVEIRTKPLRKKDKAGKEIDIPVNANIGVSVYQNSIKETVKMAGQSVGKRKYTHMK